MRRGIIIGIVSLLIIGVILGRVLRSRPAASRQGRTSPKAGGEPRLRREVETVSVEEIKLVKVIEAKRGDMQNSLSVTGTFYPWQEAKIESKVAGKIEKFLVKEGDEVEKGKPLVQLEKKERLIALAQAEASFENAEGDWKRMKELYAKRAISQQQYDKVRSGYKMAKANLDMAQAQLDNCDIRAPFSGVIVQKFRNEGEMVAQPMGMPSTPPLVVLMDISRVKVEVDIPEKRIGEVKVGQSAYVTVDGYPDKIFEGRVINVVPFVDPVSRTFKVKIEVPNEGKLLKSGMFARVKMVTKKHQNVLVVPLKAILKRGQEEVVFVVEDSLAHLRRVKTGLSDEGKIEILSGINEGDRVIIEGNYGLTEDTKVEVKASE